MSGSKFAKPESALFLLLAASLVVDWRPLLATFALAIHNDQYTHILLILPLSGAFIFLDWPLVQQRVLPSKGFGSSLMLIAIGASFFTIVWTGALNPDMRLALRMAVLVLFWIGSFALCLGSRSVRSLVFPLCFLFWLVPFPQVLLDAVVNLLQRGSTFCAYLLFAVAGVPVAVDGFVLTIPGLSVEVAQECSSIRSSSMLLVTTMVLAQVLLRSKWRKAVVIAIAVPLSVAKNGLRIFTIAMLGTKVDPGYLTGRLHHQGGIIFFAIALGGVFALIWLLKRGENKQERAQNLVVPRPVG
jgi:exosortase